MKRNRLRLYCLFFFVSMLSMGMSLQAQTITKTFRNVPLKQVLKEIEQQTKMSFVYRSSDFDANKKITAIFKDVPLREVLETILESEFEIQKNIVIIHKAVDKPAVVPATPTGQDKGKKLLSGRVVDTYGEPVIGATVRSVSSADATVTDTDGNFSISLPATGTIHVSYIGYNDREIRITSKQNITVTLEEDKKMLDEIVVIGYGTTTRRSITGAVDQVKANMLENRPVANVTQALQGAAPNLIIQRKNYNPNSEDNNINIRGISTTNSNAPLIVIDGLVSSDGALDQLNPNDIDNISVLKDAGAAAIYGSRSSNGVLLITTKKGHYNEPTKIRLSTAVGWEYPDILFTPVNGYQNATLKNVMLINSGLLPEFTPEKIKDLYDHQSEEQWFLPQIFRTALQQNHNISVQGGSQKTTYLLSGGYMNQESNYVGNKDFGVQRYNLRSNITTELGAVKVQALLAFTRNNSVSTTGSSLEIDAERIPPY